MVLCHKHFILLILLLSFYYFILLINGHNSKNEQKSSLTTTPKESNKQTFLETCNMCKDLKVFSSPSEKNKKTNKKKPSIPVINELSKEYVNKKKMELKKKGINQTSLIAVMVGFLIISTLIYVGDALKVVRSQMYDSSTPDADANKPCSLAEFANRRSRSGSTSQSSGFGYSFSEFKRDSIAILGPNWPQKTITATGARPSPISRRLSVPNLCLMDGQEVNKRRHSVIESDDESDVIHRRVRIIRRF